MECPHCSYQMDVFDTVCPRCKLHPQQQVAPAAGGPGAPAVAPRAAGRATPPAGVSSPAHTGVAPRGVNAPRAGATASTPAPAHAPATIATPSTQAAPSSDDVLAAQLAGYRGKHLARGVIYGAMAGFLGLGQVVHFFISFANLVAYSGGAVYSKDRWSGMLTGTFNMVPSFLISALFPIGLFAAVGWLIGGQCEIDVPGDSGPDQPARSVAAAHWTPLRRQGLFIGVGVAVLLLGIFGVMGLVKGQSGVDLSWATVPIQVINVALGIAAGVFIAQRRGEADFERARRQNLLVPVAQATSAPAIPGAGAKVLSGAAALAASGSAQAVASNPGNWIGILSFLFPPVGLLLYIVFEYTGHYQNSAAAGSGATLGFIFGISLAAPCFGLLIWIAYSRSEEDGKTNTAAIGSILGFILYVLYLVGKANG